MVTQRGPHIMIMESQQAINYMYFLLSQCHIHISYFISSKNWNYILILVTIKFEFLNFAWNLYKDGKNSLYQSLAFEILLKKRRYMIWQIQKIQKIKSSHMKLKPTNIFLFQAPMLLASVSFIFQTWITSTTDSSK